MFQIVIAHLVNQSGYELASGIGDSYFLLLISNGQNIANNIFIIVGAWFMLDSRFKASRLLRLYGVDIFYCWALTLISVLVWPDLCSFKDIMRGILPFMGRPLWFISAYITLMLFAPLLNKILEWDKKQLTLLTALLLYAIYFVSTMPDPQDQSYVLNTLTFPAVYLIIGYVKKYSLHESVKIPNILKLALGVGIYIGLVTLLFMPQVNGGSKIISMLSKLSKQYLVDKRTIPNFLSAILLCWFAVSIKPRHSKWINKIAQFTFPVYVFHQVPTFYPGLWKRMLNIPFLINKLGVLYPVLVFALIYIVVMVVDTARKKLVEPLWMNNRVTKKFAEKLDGYYSSLQLTTPLQFLAKI